MADAIVRTRLVPRVGSVLNGSTDVPPAGLLSQPNLKRAASKAEDLLKLQRGLGFLSSVPVPRMLKAVEKVGSGSLRRLRQCPGSRLNARNDHSWPVEPPYRGPGVWPRAVFQQPPGSYERLPHVSPCRAWFPLPCTATLASAQAVEVARGGARSRCGWPQKPRPYLVRPLNRRPTTGSNHLPVHFKLRTDGPARATARTTLYQGPAECHSLQERRLIACHNPRAVGMDSSPMKGLKHRPGRWHDDDDSRPNG